jgi:RHS repeat-associated protein
MKALLLFAIGLLSLAQQTFAQTTATNFGASLTLSAGQCAEVIPADTLRRIGRHAYSPVTGRAYRFGFQGQEKDDEIHNATGTSYNYEFRMHDPRVGRMLSIDPLTSKYPFYSPYAFSGNRVIDAVELEGLEPRAIAKQDVMTGVNYFTKPALRLLSYVSGMPESRIASTMLIPRGWGQAPYYPWNEHGEGGGAMTVWDRIVYTPNFFDAHSMYSSNLGIKPWLRLSAHEVIHLRHADAYSHTDAGKAAYLASFGAEYTGEFAETGSWSEAHDQSPREIEADQGSDTYDAFSSFVDKTYHRSDAIFHLFDDYGQGKISEDDALKTIDSWWVDYQKSITPTIQVNCDGTQCAEPDPCGP